MNKCSRKTRTVRELVCLNDTNYAGVQYIRKSIWRSGSFWNQQIRKLVVFTLHLHDYWCRAMESQCLTRKHESAKTQNGFAMCICPEWFRKISLGALLRGQAESLWGIALLKARTTDKEEREPVQIQLHIYFNFKHSLKAESNKSAFIVLMPVSRCTNMHTAIVSL